MKLSAKFIFLCSVLFIIALTLSSCFEKSNQNKPDNEFSYKDITFISPQDWESTTERIDMKSYFIKVTENTNSFMVSVMKVNEDLNIVMDSFLSTIKNTEKVNATSTPLSKGKFGKYSGLMVRYQMETSESIFYGIAYSFRANNKNVFVVKQTDSEEGLENNFKLIEDSFKVKY